MSDKQTIIRDHGIEGIEGGICVDTFGCDDFIIETGGKEIPFSFSDYMGPLPQTKRGMPRDLPPRHPFWRAVSLWRLQGKRVEIRAADKAWKAIWHEPRRPVLKHLGGKHYLVIKDGEPGHDW